MMEELFPIYPILKLSADPSTDTPAIMSIPNLCLNCMGVYWFYPTCNRCGDTCCPFNNCVRHWTDHGCFQNCTCKLCEKTFVSEERYQQHIATEEHNRIYSAAYRMQSAIEYSESYTQIDQCKAYNKAELVPNPQIKFSCNYCDEKFHFKSQLEKHLRFHSNERPFSCNKCGKRFSKKNILTNHMRTHTGKKPFICNVCSENFAQLNSLNRHKCIHTGEFFVCDVCKKHFDRKYLLLRHKRTHTGAKPFVCDVCKKGFAEKEYLFQHERIHTGEKPFECDVCKSRFARKPQLFRHERIHTGEKR